jgi:hypothetical protein
MLIEEQEDVIAMLERLRAKKRYVCCVLSFAEEETGAGGRGKGKEKPHHPASPRELIDLID